MFANAISSVRESVDTIAKYGSEIMSFVAGLAGGSLLTLKFIRKTSVSGEGSNVNQAAASARGDLVGRDKISGRDQH
jgi:hypothetical protein